MTVRAMSGDAGGIVTGWLLKLFAVFAVLGVITFDAVSMTLARVTASDDARSIAEATSDALNVRNLKPERAIEAGQDRASDHNVVLRPGDLVIAKDGTVTARIHRTADTLVAFRIPKVQDYVVVDAVHVVPGQR